MTQELTVHVPVERITEFYQWFGIWMAGEGLPRVEEIEPDLSPWTENDGELAAGVWNKMSDPAKRIFAKLIDNPGSKIQWKILARTAELENGMYGVAGALAWPGRHSYEVLKEFPVEYEATPDGALYWMEPSVAAAFYDARNS